jgi:hypothetical protein
MLSVCVAGGPPLAKELWETDKCAIAGTLLFELSGVTLLVLGILGCVGQCPIEGLTVIHAQHLAAVGAIQLALCIAIGLGIRLTSPSKASSSTSI